MKYVIPRDVAGALSATQVELHCDDGSVRYITLASGNAYADEFQRWKEAGGVPENAAPLALDHDAVASECQRRIYAVASQNCQMNMTAWIASGQADEKDRTAFVAALGWVQEMRAAYAKLIASADPDFTADAKWPPIPAGVADLAARF